MSLKIEIARRQLGMATHLYLPDLDPVSVHCLANAGCELIKLYAKKLRGKAILSKTSARRFHQASTPAPVWIAFKQATRPAPIEWSGGDVSLGMGAVPA
jgi:hypothetical protein